MNENKKGYRAFPPIIGHPRGAALLSREEFDRTEKLKLQEVASMCPGHKGTVVWYAKEKGYIIQIILVGKPDIFATSICTFTPTFGMDQIDGLFAQDVEEYFLQKELGRATDRLNVFNEMESIPVEEYLRNRGVIE